MEYPVCNGAVIYVIYSTQSFLSDGKADVKQGSVCFTAHDDKIIVPTALESHSPAV